MKSFKPQNSDSKQVRIRTVSQPYQRQKQTFKQRKLSTQNIKENKNSLPQQNKSSISFIISLLLQNKTDHSNPKYFTNVKNLVKQKPGLAIKLKENSQKASYNSLKLSKKYIKNQIDEKKISSKQQNSELKRIEEPIVVQKRIKNEQLNQQMQNHPNKDYQLNEKSGISVRTNYEQNRPVNKYKVSFRICNQFSICIISSDHRQKISTQTQTTFYEYQDKLFYEEFCKYRYIKSNIFAQVQQKQEAIDRLKQESIQFKKHYQDLINFISGQPQNDREKRVFQISQQLQSAQVKVNQMYKHIFDAHALFEEDLLHKMPLVYNKKDKLRLSIFQSLNTLLETSFQIPNSQLQQYEQSPPTEQSRIQKIINEMKIINQIDDSFKIYVFQMFRLCHSRIVEFQTAYKNWSNLYYQNRVLLYNFMKHIQKMPALMTQLFGCRKAQNEGEQSSKKDRQHLLKEYLSSKCEQCFHYKTKIIYLQQSNQEIRPIFKALQLLLRDGSKRQSCIELI